MIIQDIDKFPMAIPKEIEDCPYCDGMLCITGIDEWEVDPEGGVIAVTISIECETEPEMDEESDEWDDWFRTHSEMPYVYMLPIYAEVLDWLRSEYRFVWGRDEQRN